MFFSSNEHFLFPGLVAEVNERGCPFLLSVTLIFHHAVISCLMVNFEASFAHFETAAIFFHLSKHSHYLSI